VEDTELEPVTVWLLDASGKKSYSTFSPAIRLILSLRYPVAIYCTRLRLFSKITGKSEMSAQRKRVEYPLMLLD
jgi:hypothetical protein